MDPRLFEKSPHVASLLVRLYDSQKLYGLARDSQPEARMELSSVMSDLLEHELSGREQELVADVLITLIRHAERGLRQVLAERLSKMKQVPLRLVLHLVNDEILVAGPMLRDSPVLSDLDLVYIIKSQGPEYWQAIAAREKLNDGIVNMLADKRELGTALVLTQNERLRLTTHALEILSHMAVQTDELAGPLLMREEMPPSLARRLYSHVGQELKSYITSFYGVVPSDVAQAVDEVILDFVDATAEPAFHERESGAYLPHDYTMIAIEKAHRDGRLKFPDMMDILKKGLIQEFIGMMALYTNTPADKLCSVLAESGGRKLAILCRAHDIQKSDFSTIYLVTHRMRSSDRLVNHKELLAALSYFDEIRPEAARNILTRH